MVVKRLCQSGSRHYFDIQVRYSEVTVLIDNAGLPFNEFGDRFVGPPWDSISILVELSTVIIKSMSDFVANYHTYG